MILCVADVLSGDELARIQQWVQTAEFVDGKLTAGWHARLVKHNQQVDRKSGVHRELTQTVMAALKRNELFQMAARPKVIRPPLFSRYEVGMSYGTHVDNAVMNAPSQSMRTDLSFTIFLNSPDSYEGGELVIENTRGEEAIKLEAGSMVIYPSSTLHRVETVTSGRRLVAVSWIQSQVRSPEQREILFDLDTTRRSLFKQQGKTAEFDQLTKSLANLMRMWVEI